MKTSESYIHLEWRRPIWRLFRAGISAVQKAGDTRLEVFFPTAHKVARRFAEKVRGQPGNALTEILFGTPMTAHIMSGAAIGTGPENGVVNDAGEAFGYRNLRVLDGSIIPGNLGVNPSLTITALSEYAMSRVPEFDTARASKIRPIRFSTPLAAQVSPLRAEGELLRQVLETTRFLYLFCRT
jgi:cholesterol oxidase